MITPPPPKKSSTPYTAQRRSGKKWPNTAEQEDIL